MASMPADAGPCPCCPDGADSVAACLAACSAAVGITCFAFRVCWFVPTRLE